MIPSNEDELVDAVAEQILERRRVEKVFTRENIANRGIAEYMDEWYDRTGFKSQEIDLLVVRSAHKLEAIEVKYFRADNGSPHKSFYWGISQAVALVRTGVDYVVLDHYFDPAIDPAHINEYGDIVNTLRVGLDLPFEYRCFLIEDRDDGFARTQIQPISENDELQERSSFVAPRISNPLLEDSARRSEVEQTREFLKRVLKIPGD